MIKHTQYIFILLLLLPVLGQTQGEPDTVGSLAGIEIKTSVDKAEVYIGDLITYAVTIEYDSTHQLEPPPLGANLGAFDVKDYEPDVETMLDGGRLQSKTTFVLSTFTTGDYIIPAVPVLFTLPDSSRKLLFAEPVPITVLSLLENAGDSLDIRELKPPHEFPRDYSRYYLWGALGGIALVIALILWWLVRRRRRSEDEIDPRPPWEKAYERLAYLNEKGLPANGEFKAYYYELTEVVREYLGAMYVRDVPEMTTEEFTGQFSSVDLPGNLYQELLAFFGHADMVKFARYEPGEKRPAIDFDFAHTLIETVREDFIQEEETSEQPPLDRPIDQVGRKEEVG